MGSSITVKELDECVYHTCVSATISYEVLKAMPFTVCSTSGFGPLDSFTVALQQIASIFAAVVAVYVVVSGPSTSRSQALYTPQCLVIMCVSKMEQLRFAYIPKNAQVKAREVL